MVAFKKSACLRMVTLGLVGMATVAQATNWTVTHGGALDDAANWGGTLPGASENAYVDTLQSAPLTLNADWSLYRLWLRHSSGTNEFSFAGKELLASDRIFFENGGTTLISSGIVGVKPAGNRIFIGDGTGSSRSTVIVDGPDSELRSAVTDNDGEYKFIAIGAKASFVKLIVRNGGTVRGALRFGTDHKGVVGNISTNNSFIVTGTGSSYQSSDNRHFLVGHLGTGHSVDVLDHANFLASNGVWMAAAAADSAGKAGFSNQNRFTVADGARTDIFGEVFVGTVGASNVLEVGNGGLVVQTNRNDTLKLTVGQGSAAISNAVANLLHIKRGGLYRRVSDHEFSTDSNKPHPEVNLGGEPGMDRNRLLVEGRFESDLSKEIDNWRIGVKGSSNRVEVTNGGEVHDTGLRSVIIGAASGACHNGLIVANGSVFASTNRFNVRVGEVVGADDNYVVVTNGGRFSFLTTDWEGDHRLTIGHKGARCGITVADSELIMTNFYLVVGGELSGSNSWGVISGSKVDCRRLIVSDRCPNCVLTLRNSQVTVKTSVDIGYSAWGPDNSLPSVPTNNVVRFEGTNTALVATSDVMRLCNDSKLVFAIPGDASVASPVVKVKAFNTTHRAFDRKARIAVEVPESRRIGQRVTLIESSESITDANFNNIDFILPEGVEIIREPKKIIAHVRSTCGTMMIFR